MKKIIYTIIACSIIGVGYAQQKPNSTKTKQTSPPKTTTKITPNPSTPNHPNSDTIVHVSPQSPAAVNSAQISFYEEMHVFPNIQKGAIYAYEFKFMNTGNSPLVILNVEGVTANYSKDSVQAGGSASITVNFTVGKEESGEINKEVIIHSNAVNQSAKKLYLKGIVTN